MLDVFERLMYAQLTSCLQGVGESFLKRNFYLSEDAFLKSLDKENNLRK